MNHYCVVLLTVCAIVASTNAAATTTTTAATSGGTGGNMITNISKSVRHLIDQVICLIRAVIELMQTMGGIGGGIGGVFINPWIGAMQAFIHLIQDRVRGIPFLQL